MISRYEMYLAAEDASALMQRRVRHSHSGSKQRAPGQCNNGILINLHGMFREASYCTSISFWLQSRFCHPFYGDTRTCCMSSIFGNWVDLQLQANAYVAVQRAKPQQRLQQLNYAIT